MTSSCSDSDSSSCNERFAHSFKEELLQNIKSHDKKQLALKRLADSRTKLERNNKLKKCFVKLSKVIYDHLKKKIRSLGLGSNIVERYIEYLPDNLYFIWKFGKDGYDMHSTESRTFIRQAIDRIGMKKMIDQQIQTLNTYNIAVKFGFNNGDEAYDCEFLMFFPDHILNMCVF